MASDIVARFYRSGNLLLAKAMDIVRVAQLTGDANPSMKSDVSLLTATDLASEKVILGALNNYFPEALVWSEEAGKSSGKGRFLVLVDPLDGTHQFACGMSGSTIIVALYDNVLKRVVCCHVAEPSTGRIWSASETTKTRVGISTI